jgi:uncharacterized protein YjiS (DUF1127 family)
MTLSPLAAAEPKLRKSPKLKPFTVRRHDMWNPASSRMAVQSTAADYDMSPLQPIDSVDVRADWLLSLLPAISWPFRMIALAWHRQGQARDLNGLDEHLLADMGLTRADIRDALRKGQHPHPERPE